MSSHLRRFLLGSFLKLVAKFANRDLSVPLWIMNIGKVPRQTTVAESMGGRSLSSMPLPPVTSSSSSSLTSSRRWTVASVAVKCITLSSAAASLSALAWFGGVRDAVHRAAREDDGSLDASAASNSATTASREHSASPRNLHSTSDVLVSPTTDDDIAPGVVGVFSRVRRSTRRLWLRTATAMGKTVYAALKWYTMGSAGALLRSHTHQQAVGPAAAAGEGGYLSMSMLRAILPVWLTPLAARLLAKDLSSVMIVIEEAVTLPDATSATVVEVGLAVEGTVTLQCNATATHRFILKFTTGFDSQPQPSVKTGNATASFATRSQATMSWQADGRSDGGSSVGSALRGDDVPGGAGDDVVPLSDVEFGELVDRAYRKYLVVTPRRLEPGLLLAKYKSESHGRFVPPVGVRYCQFLPWTAPGSRVLVIALSVFGTVDDAAVSITVPRGYHVRGAATHGSGEWGVIEGGSPHDIEWRVGTVEVTKSPIDLKFELIVNIAAGDGGADGGHDLDGGHVVGGSSSRGSGVRVTPSLPIVSLTFKAAASASGLAVRKVIAERLTMPLNTDGPHSITTLSPVSGAKHNPNVSCVAAIHTCFRQHVHVTTASGGSMMHA